MGRQKLTSEILGGTDMKLISDSVLLDSLGAHKWREIELDSSFANHFTGRPRLVDGPL